MTGVGALDITTIQHDTITKRQVLGAIRDETDWSAINRHYEGYRYTQKSIIKGYFCRLNLIAITIWPQQLSQGSLLGQIAPASSSQRPGTHRIALTPKQKKDELNTNYDVAAFKFNSNYPIRRVAFKDTGNRYSCMQVTFHSRHWFISGLYHGCELRETKSRLSRMEVIKCQRCHAY